MSNLFEIQSEYLDLMTQIEENEGVFPEGVEEALQANEEEFTNKADNYLKMLSHWKGQILSLDAEIERLSKLKNTFNTSIESLKNNLSASLQSRGIDKMNLDRGKLSFRKSEAVVVTDPTTIPDDFVKTKTTESIDKTGLKKWLKEGNEISGAYIEERQNLQIK